MLSFKNIIYLFIYWFAPNDFHLVFFFDVHEQNIRYYVEYILFCVCVSVIREHVRKMLSLIWQAISIGVAREIVY